MEYRGYIYPYIYIHIYIPSNSCKKFLRLTHDTILCELEILMIQRWYKAELGIIPNFKRSWADGGDTFLNI